MMSNSFYTIQSHLHPALAPQTTDAIHLLDSIRDARQGDLVAASSAYRIDEAGNVQSSPKAHIWVQTKHGILPKTIFDVEAAKIPAASIAMVHVEHDPVLQSIGDDLLDLLGPNPADRQSCCVDLICLCTGIVALRRMSNIADYSSRDDFQDALPTIAVPLVLESLSGDKQASVSFDLSVFLSQVFSAQLPGRGGEGREDLSSNATITIMPP
jgi:hypothetical protein